MQEDNPDKILFMKVLTVQLTDHEFSRLGFASDQIEFDELVRRIKIAAAREAMLKCHAIAHKAGLANSTMEDINVEIEAVRNAETNH